MKKLFLLLIFLLPSIISAQESSASSLGSPDAISSVMPTLISVDEGVVRDIEFVDEKRSCDEFVDLIDSVSKDLVSSLNFNNTSFVNVTNKYCWNNAFRTSVSVNLLVKNDSDSLVGKQVSFNFYVNDVVDYDTVFSKEENDNIGYFLKEKYLDYLINGTDEEFYVSINPEYSSNGDYDCSGLRIFYDSLSKDAYFNEDVYCQLVVKISISDIKDYAKEGYVNFFGDKISFSYEGYSVGDFDLNLLKDSLDCDIKEGYEFDDFGSCYGVFKDENRIYFSSYKEFEKSSVSVSVYGFVNGNARINVNVYGENADNVLGLVNDFVSSITIKYFGKDLSPELKLNEYEGRISPYSYKSYTGTARITNLNFNSLSINGLKSNEDKMNTYYSDEENNVYLTISVPFIQVFYSDVDEQVIEGGSDVVSKMIAPYPYPRQNSFVITKDKVFSQTIIDSDDYDLAVSEIKSVLNKYVNTSDWVLTSRVTSGNYYPYPLMYAEDGVSVRSLSASVESSVSVADSAIPSSGSSFEDSFLSDYPEFDELNDDVVEEKSFLGFLKQLLGLN